MHYDTSYGYYMIYPKQPYVVAFGPILPNLDEAGLKEAHQVCVEDGSISLWETRWLDEDGVKRQTVLFMGEYGYGDAPVEQKHFGVCVRKTQMLKLSSDYSGALIRASLDGLLPPQRIEQVCSLFAMNIPLPAETMELLTQNAVCGSFTNAGFLVDNGRPRVPYTTLISCTDDFILEPDDLGQTPGL